MDLFEYTMQILIHSCVCHITVTLQFSLMTRNYCSMKQFIHFIHYLINSFHYHRFESNPFLKNNRRFKVF